MNSVGNNTDEAEVIACICAGSTHLFHELIRPYERTVYGMVLTLVQNKEDAEDIAQETFLKAFRFLGTFRADSKFSTWLISIALNEAKLKLRRSKTVALESLDENAEDRTGISPQVLIDWHRARIMLQKQLAPQFKHLSPKRRWLPW
jgi:RNA polymerase sigma-70 factor (ECF subfamily)